MTIIYIAFRTDIDTGELKYLANAYIDESDAIEHLKQEVIKHKIIANTNERYIIEIDGEIFICGIHSFSVRLPEKLNENSKET